jgi:fumarate reductase subunit C
VFYGIFVLAVSVHAGIGLRTVLREWTVLENRACGWLALVIALLLCVLGLRAVYAVIS